MVLTDEQKMLVKLVSEGLTNIDIAEEMGYSPATVKLRLKALFKLFNVSNRVTLVNKAVCLQVIC